MITVETIDQARDLVRVTRRSSTTGVMNSMEMVITPTQWTTFSNPGGPLIQDIFPDLSVDEREFLMTGTTPEEWAAIFPPEDDEE